MSAPQREQHGGGARSLPDDLRQLRQLHEELPPPAVRWETQPGQAFLNHLFECVERHQAKGVAAALGISAQAVYYMLDRPRLRSPHPFPGQGEMRELRQAWRIAAASGRTVRRKDPLYLPVHLALAQLLRRYPIRYAAAAIPAPVRQVRRFVPEPLDSPAAIARAIEELL